MSNIVENNNSVVGFSQVWPEYIYTDIIPNEPPALKDAEAVDRKNLDGSIYTLRVFYKETDNEIYPYLVHISNFQLTKEYRQENIWKLEFNNDEESIRRIIFPGKTTNRSYTPSFNSKGQVVPFTNVNPTFDLKDCRIYTGVSFEELYFTGWLYVGKNLIDFFDVQTLPFNDQLWLLKNKDGDKIRFDINQEKVYVLPPDLPLNLPPDNRYDEGRKSLEEFNDLKAKGDVLVTTNSLNTILYHMGELDGGEYWYDVGV